MMDYFERHFVKLLFAAIIASVSIAMFATMMAFKPPVQINESKFQKIVHPPKFQDQIDVTQPKGDTEAPKTIRVVPIVPPPKPEPYVKKDVPAPTEGPPVATAKPPVETPVPNPEEPTSTGRHWRAPSRGGGGDICSRTGGRKVETNHGRSWRCVYRR